MSSPPLFEPMPPYFIIKIGKEEQRKRKEYLTKHIIANPGSIAMTRELQFGQIISIGSAAKEWMPCAEIGDYLLVHHFISGKVSEKGYNFYLVDHDNDFNYYAVNSFEIPGERAMAYAVAKGTEIIPTPDYIFLEVDKETTQEELMKMSVGENGLIVPREKKKTREEWTAIMKQNMERCRQLSNNLPRSTMDEILIHENPERRERYEYAVSEIKKLEAINLKISKDINKKRYEPFVVAAINPDWADAVAGSDGTIVPGDTVYMLNLACHYHIDFSGTTFIVAETKYFAISENQIKKDIANFNSLHGLKRDYFAPAGGTRKVRN